MTRFGPGSWMLDSLDALMNMDKSMLFKMPSNAISLAPGPVLYQKDDEKVVQICQEEQVNSRFGTEFCNWFSLRFCTSRIAWLGATGCVRQWQMDWVE